MPVLPTLVLLRMEPPMMVRLMLEPPMPVLQRMERAA